MQDPPSPTAESAEYRAARAHDFVVPVERVAATLVLQDGSHHEVVLPRAGGVPLETLFAASEPFVPVQEAGKMRLYARVAIACLIVPSRPRSLAPEDEDALPMIKRGARVQLTAGEVLEGELSYVRVEGRGRVSDLLNEPGPSFALEQQGLVVHVAKQHVLFVEER